MGEVKTRAFTVVAYRRGADDGRYDIVAPTESDAITQAEILYVRTHPNWNMFGNDVSFRIDRFPKIRGSGQLRLA